MAERISRRQRRDVVRDISYASSAASRGGQRFIRGLESLTGRGMLVRRADGYDAEVAAGADFWQVMPRRMGVTLDVISGSLDNVPAAGPLIVVSNHPFGILDGLIMGHFLSTRRGGDFRILANQVFRKAEDVNRVILPISFDATALNIATRAEALRYLGAGGAIGVFPGGTVSTAATPFGRALDPRWRSFTAKMIARSDAAVVPIWFDGSNSRLFQIVSHLHTNLRLGLLIREFRARIDQPVRVAIGQPLDRAALAQFRGEPKRMMDFLREATYALARPSLSPTTYGKEFDERYKQEAR